MADFVAVIRRAVDGLSNNTPEMRAKVYEKARGAVMRQLQNMSPRPPEEMLRRQLDKLEAAIVEVEAEHAEALMAIEEEAATATAAAYVAPAFVEPEPVPPEPVEPEAPAEPEPAPVEAPVVAAAPEPWSPEPETSASPSVDTDEPASVGENAAHPVEHAAQNPDVFAPMVDDRSGAVAAERPRYDYPEVTADEPAADRASPAVDADDHFAADAGSAAPGAYAPWPEPEPEPVRTPPAADVEAWDETPQPDRLAQWPDDAETVVHGDVQDRPVTPVTAPPAFGDWPPYEEDAPDPFVLPEDATAPVAPIAPDAPKAKTFDEAGALGEFDDFVRSGQSKRPAPEMPPALDLLEWDEADHQTSFAGKAAAPDADLSDGADAGWFKDFDQGAANASAVPAAARGNGAKAQTASTEDIDALLANAEQKAYRRDDKPRRNYAPVVLGVAGVLLLAGAGYGLWINRDAVGSLVEGLMSSAPQTETASEETTADTETPGTIVPSGNGTIPADPAANGTPPADGSVTGHKFTQRLLPDGGEVDEGVGAAPGSAVPAGEGTSVAEKNVPSATSPTTPAIQAPAAAEGAATTTPAPATPGAPTAPAATAASDVAMPVDGQKAFLYEERLGQTVPTTVPGHIVWTALRETADNGKAEPVIQGSLSIPGRGLTALITFKRNADNSLPASHLAEVVFSVPADFEGGAIDSIQRIAMKATEQDRGDPLIAVTAKITDDTYMIAFNDFAEVVARNLELLQSRGWIDIPVTYRNGRRALLTLDKGAQGKAVFDSVIKEWSTMSSARGG
ncbi:hypothetical protein HGO38_07265 [Rhizobium sp. CG5]|uniref:hypothetical protein n=1 Tax=Rhizobium sp. CG5 TaxID=2726076 RepID=UPI0020339360|nr:hypothetical protein [Rhizobium sp. CG5]MCM2473277.1 hypothetical protein [Rhizobium sp. CG5]